MPKYHHTSSAEKRFASLTAKYELDWEYHHELALLAIMEEIARAMESSGTSKAKLAEKLDVSRAYITQLLGGNTNVSLRTLFKVSWALDLKPIVRFEQVRPGNVATGRRNTPTRTTQRSAV
jgi:DNA-binding phage protein